MYVKCFISTTTCFTYASAAWFLLIFSHCTWVMNGVYISDWLLLWTIVEYIYNGRAEGLTSSNVKTLILLAFLTTLNERDVRFQLNCLNHPINLRGNSFNNENIWRSHLVDTHSHTGSPHTFIRLAINWAEKCQKSQNFPKCSDLILWEFSAWHLTNCVLHFNLYLETDN